MSGIKRWEFDEDYGMVWSESGEYVSLADHEAEVARLRAELEGRRVNAERYLWLRNKSYMLDGMSPAVIVAESDFPVDDPRTDGFVFHDELDSAIDAAMGHKA